MKAENLIDEKSIVIYDNIVCTVKSIRSNSSIVLETWGHYNIPATEQKTDQWTKSLLSLWAKSDDFTVTLSEEEFEKYMEEEKIAVLPVRIENTYRCDVAVTLPSGWILQPGLLTVQGATPPGLIDFNYFACITIASTGERENNFDIWARGFMQLVESGQLVRIEN